MLYRFGRLAGLTRELINEGIALRDNRCFAFHEVIRVDRDSFECLYVKNIVDFA